MCGAGPGDLGGSRGVGSGRKSRENRLENLQSDSRQLPRNGSCTPHHHPTRAAKPASYIGPVWGGLASEVGPQDLSERLGFEMCSKRCPICTLIGFSGFFFSRGASRNPRTPPRVGGPAAPHTTGGGVGGAAATQPGGGSGGAGAPPEEKKTIKTCSKHVKPYEKFLNNLEATIRVDVFGGRLRRDF